MFRRLLRPWCRVPRFTRALPIACLLVTFALTFTSGSADAQTLEEARALLREQKFTEAAGVLAKVTEQEPENGLAWYLRGAANHSATDHAEAVAAFERADALGFNVPGTRYNMACALALMGETQRALDALASAADAGFNQLATLDTDTDLTPLRNDARFAEIRAQVEKAAKPCDDESFRRFDFWLGQWTVTSNGQFAGKNEIVQISEGCALYESWENGAGITGHSISFYDPNADRWKQTWVGGGGSILEFVEVDPKDYDDGAMRFVATAQGAQGTSLQRMTYYDNPDGSVRQLIETSTDGGETWTPSFDGLYVQEDRAAAESGS